MGNLIEISKMVGASLERTWEAWTDGEKVAIWFSPETNIEVVVGGPYELFFDPADHKIKIFFLVRPNNRLPY